MQQFCEKVHVDKDCPSLGPSFSFTSEVDKPTFGFDVPRVNPIQEELATGPPVHAQIYINTVFPHCAEDVGEFGH